MRANMGRLLQTEQNKVLPQEAGVYTVLIPIQQSQRPWTNYGKQFPSDFSKTVVANVETAYRVTTTQKSDWI